jgi:hypothetical protein
MTRTTIDSWPDLQLNELFYAYRKAKADCFFERALSVSRRFVEFEARLPQNLGALLVRLRSHEIRTVLDENIGEPRISAKKLTAEPKSSAKMAPKGHGFFSEPSHAFRYLCETHTLSPEFRLVGNFSVQMHVLSALWINLVGHKFDGVLGKSAYGSRLRRYRPEPGAPEGAVGDYHTEAVGSFRPYVGPYKEWRKRGLNAIREELIADRPVIGITMDLTSYYHRIDPSFFANKAFLDYAGINLSEGELEFTRAFSEVLVKWSDRAHKRLIEFGCDADKISVGGLPIGLSISPVVANSLLIGLDREIVQQLSPVYYGRYMDDLFLVLRDPETIDSVPKLLEFISSRTDCFPSKGKGKNNNEMWLRLPDDYGGNTTLLLQQSKQKVFFLQGQGGLDLLDSIESQIRSVASERRLMPSPDNLASTAAAKVLTAAGEASEEADTLRRADGLSVRRLGWAVLLSAVETLARDLRQDDWKKERDQFYKFGRNHILRPDRILDHLDYLPRLLSLAVALMDWPDAKRLLDAALDSLNSLQRASISSRFKVNGFEAIGAGADLWGEVRQGVLDSAADAIIRALRWGSRDGGPRPLAEVGIRVCKSVGLEATEEELQELSKGIRECDWAKISYKDHLRRDAKRERPLVDGEGALYGLYAHHDDLSEFLSKSSLSQGLSSCRVNPRCQDDREGHEKTVSMLPYLFPTRAYTTQEVSLFLPDECVFAGGGIDPRGTAKRWARFVRAVRGVWVWDSLGADNNVAAAPPNRDEGTLRMAVLGSPEKDQAVLLGISSLLTTDDSWKAAAHSKIDLSRERYKRIKRLVDQAVQAYPRPTHLLVPELSLPPRWIDTVSALLRESGISLIAGLDYHHSGAHFIHSEAVLVLSDDRLGFPTFVQIHQPKTSPAPGEEETLLRDFGKTWKPFSRHDKPIYLHKGFAFGVLCCSELQNVSHRLNVQGAVDCLMVLAWNKDLDTFAALVESASIDIHAYIALVNNRRYGDGRVRAPAKAQFDRDLCRIRGGNNEHVVVVRLGVEKLRAFQSRAKRWPSDSDPFKPVPEGFRIRPYRERVPE